MQHISSLFNVSMLRGFASSWFRWLVLLLALCAGSAMAATYSVTTLGDGAGSCAGTSCTTLRAALGAANATGEADTIEFSAGLGTGAVNIGSQLPDISTQITLDGGNRITLNGGGLAFPSIVISGAGASGSQVRNIGITNFNQTLIGVVGAPNVVLNNNVLNPPFSHDAIRCLNSDNCTVSNNQITGGFYAISFFNTAAVGGYNGTVTGNTSTGSVYGLGLSSVQNVTVSNNSFTGSSQSGIRIVPFYAGGGTDNNVISGNTISGSTRAGIVFELSGGVVTATTVDNNRITGNTIVNNGGAGISMISSAVPSITNTTITGNTITGNAGAGVLMSGTALGNNAVYDNLNLSGNGGLGIDLLGNAGVTANDAGDGDIGANGLQNFPVITRIVGNQVSFVLDTPANANGFRIDFYNNPGGLDATGYGEGQVPLGNCVVTSVSATAPGTCTLSGVNAATLRMTATRCQTASCAPSALTSIGATSEFNGGTVDLQLTKTDGETLYSPGQTLTYTIVVGNSPASMGPVLDAVLTDPAVVALTVNSVTCGSATNGSACPSVGNTTVALMQGSGIVIPTVTAGGSVTFTVAATATATSGNLVNTATVALPPGLTDVAPANNVASDTNARRPELTLRKTTTGGVGGPFGFTLTNTAQLAGSVSTAVADTPTQVDGDAVAGMQPFSIGTPGSDVTINENSLPTGWVLSGATCVNASAAVVGSLSGSTYTIPGAATGAGASITCTFTNAQRPVLRLSKSLPDGRVQASDQFTLNIAGTGGPASATTTGSTVAPTETAVLNTTTIGGVYTLSEVGGNLAAYVSSYACTNALAGGQTPSGSGTSFNVTPVAGDDLSCVFTNAMPRADLSIVKVASPTAAVTGGLANFTLTVSNAGPSAANGAVVRDGPDAGLDCAQAGLAAPTCNASGGAACPGGLTSAALLGASGVAIPTLPAGGGVAITMQCRVTATGLP